MAEQKLTDALGKLREEKDQLENPDSRERLTILVENIEQKLDYSAIGDEQHDLVEDVKDAITHFEVEHPRITGILNEIMMALSNAGI